MVKVNDQSSNKYTYYVIDYMQKIEKYVWKFLKLAEFTATQLTEQSALPTLQTPVLISQQDGEKTSTITISNPNSVEVELWNNTYKVGDISASSQQSFAIPGSTSLHFEAIDYINSSSISITFVPVLTIDDIIEASQADKINEGWVGIQIPIKIDNKDVLFRISDVNTYVLSDGSGKSHYTLEMVDVLEERRMNATNTNTGGWAETEAEAYLNSEEALNRIEEKVRNAIQQVKIPYGAIYNKDSLQYVDNKVFYPSHTEIGLTKYTPRTIEGRLWKYYNDNNTDSAKIKHLNSQARMWWLRTCFIFFNSDFFCVTGAGKDDYYGANNTRIGSSWAFCI